MLSQYHVTHDTDLQEVCMAISETEMNHLKKLHEQFSAAVFQEEDKNKPKIVDPRRLPGRITAQNPMSPYTPPVSGYKFTDISDIINHKQYKGSYPQSYAPVPEYFRKFGISPYYEPENFNDYACGVLTIATMIELTVNNQPWKLERDQDIAEVYQYAKTYYEALKNPDYENNKFIQAYKEKVVKFLKRLKPKVEIFAKKRGVFDLSDGLFALLAKLRGNNV